MEAGIVGLPNVGKSTLFNALTEAGAEASNYPFCTIEPNTGVVKVPDSNLQLINQFQPTEQILPSIVRIVDIAGLVRGASKGEGLGNKFLSHIREVDAILQVVRCFEDENITHVDGTIDPIRDIETIETELMLADLETSESALQKAGKLAKGGDKEAQLRARLLEQCVAALGDGKPIRTLGITDPEEVKMLKSFGMLSAKRVLYITNVSEEDLEAGTNAQVEAVKAYAAANGGEVTMVCAKIESELSELDPEDRKEMLESLGMTEPALDKVIRGAYHLLGLQSYYTAGPKEIRAWPIRIGTRAPQAAGVIHGDFERGFIRAEVFSVDDLVEYKTEAAIKSHGKLRVEGKEYVMQENDVVHFLFNV
ncbi:MAG: GTP-binding protein YchF [Kiritimatiellia bacterium]|jgi:ribosome-binding ATPase